MLALLAWMGTNIFWTLTTKDTLVSQVAPSLAVETEPRKLAQTLTAQHLFGEVANAAAVAAAPSDIRLSGVIAAAQPGQMAMAFLAVDGKPAVAVRVGEEVSPGTTLKQVQPRQVELVRNGQVMVLALPEPNKSGAQPGKPAPQATYSPPQASYSLPQVDNPTPRPSRRSFRRGSPSTEPD